MLHRARTGARAAEPARAPLAPRPEAPAPRVGAPAGFGRAAALALVATAASAGVQWLLWQRVGALPLKEALPLGALAAALVWQAWFRGNEAVQRATALGQALVARPLVIAAAAGGVATLTWLAAAVLANLFRGWN